ncbi:hypothetical protein MKX01_012974 [Papaver californicum]|nr:hypothetical protein MKX01_012974 [Papaver californicum]
MDLILRQYWYPFVYTPLITNSHFSSEYFVDVKSIIIDGANVALNRGLLTINKKNGVGGTKFSTLRAKAMGISMVAPIAPFSACFNVSTIENRPDGHPVPTIILSLPNKVNWHMIGSRTSLKYVNRNVLCLAFVDGGSKPKTSIVIGGHHMQNTIIEFDIAGSILGFSEPFQV